MDIGGYRCAVDTRHQGWIAVVSGHTFRRCYCCQCATSAILRDDETFTTVLDIAQAWLHDGDIGETSKNFESLIPTYWEPDDPGYKEALAEFLKPFAED